MKKILFLILPLFFFLFLAKPSFAQNTTGNPLFDFFVPGAPKIFFNVPDSAKDQTFSLLPFTKITVTNGTFGENNVNIFVFEGDFDKIKAKMLQQGQSPIASYYLVFENSKGKLLTPAKPIKLDIINNFNQSVTFYFPLGINGKIDTKNQANKPGPAHFKTDLPIEDPAFVVSVNKNISKDSSIFGSGKQPDIQITTGANFQEPKKMNSQIILLAVIILLLLAFVGILLFVRRKTPRKIKKIEEPPKIVVGK